MTRVLLVFAVWLAVAAVRAEDGEQAMSAEEAAQFWSVPDTAMSWRKVTGPDFEVYYGKARPPARGEVGIYMGNHPSFQPPEDRPAIDGKLGTYNVRWYESREEDGAARKETLVHVGPFYRFHIWIYGKEPADIAAIEKELTKYPVFSPRPSEIPAQ